MQPVLHHKSLPFRQVAGGIGNLFNSHIPAELPATSDRVYETLKIECPHTLSAELVSVDALVAILAKSS